MINVGRVNENIPTFINRLRKIITFLIKSCRKWALSPKIWTFLAILLAAFLLFWYPQWRVSQFGITSPKDLAEMENSYRVTLAQMLGGIAIAISLYYTWRRINISQEGQITERFTKAVDQLGAIDHLGNPAIEVRLGGIYALERIADQSNKDYWPIMEILTAYVRKNSSVKNFANKTFTDISMDIQANETTKKEVPDPSELSSDIQAIITVIKRRKWFFNNGESIVLDLQRTNLRMAFLLGAHLEGASLYGAHLEKANLEGANLEGANLKGANLEKAYLKGASLEGANLEKANLEKAYLEGAKLEEANLEKANLERAFLFGAKLEGAHLWGAHLEGAHLWGAHLEGAHLWGAHLEGAYLEEAHLAGANLEGAHLEGANLKGAHLEGAHLEGANLEGANLKGASLEGADLEGAYLEGAYLEGAENLSFDQLAQVKTLYIATIDDKLLIPLKEKYPNLFKPHN